MNLTTLKDCFILKLQSLYDVEKEIVASLPHMIESASDPELKSALSDHLKETEEHIRRLESVFEIIESPPERMEVRAIRGLNADSAWLTTQEGAPAAHDSSLIAAAQYIEHYEIAGYRSLIRWANLLNLSKAEKMLDKTVRDEEKADETLAHIAERVNLAAL